MNVDTHLQDHFYEAIARRGYTISPDRVPWTHQQLLIRQLFKLLEETCEAILATGIQTNVPGSEELIESLHETLCRAGDIFDSPTGWEYTAVGDLKALAKELADVQVVLMCSAAALDRIIKQKAPRKSYSVLTSAVRKSNSDISRGVRKKRRPSFEPEVDPYQDQIVQSPEELFFWRCDRCGRSFDGTAVQLEDGTVINLEKERVLNAEGKEISLSHQEWLILTPLVVANGGIVPTKLLDKEVGHFGGDYIRHHIHRLRVKLGREAISTISNRGYRLMTKNQEECCG